MPMYAPQLRENLEYLLAHLVAMRDGLLALQDLLQQIPPDQSLRAGSVRTLLQPITSEAEQAQPLAELLLDEETTA